MWKFDIGKLKFNSTDVKKNFDFIENIGNENAILTYSDEILNNDLKLNQLRINFNGDVKSSGGFLRINNLYGVPINSMAVIPITPPCIINFEIIIPAKSAIRITELDFEFTQDKDLTENLSNDNNVLVITPAYPSSVNLYSCAFAHSRNKEYKSSGIKLQVFAVNSTIWYQTQYELDGVPVFSGTYKDLKKVLSKHQYKIVITHFVDEKLYPLFDGNIYENEQLIFICHGPETVYKYLANKTRPYFTAPYPEPIKTKEFDLRDHYVKKYSQKDNVEWVFVSDWLKTFSEEQQGIKFKNVRVINNIISEKLFPYKPRNPEDRKKILLVRKFDNICQHSIDQVVLCIRELSRRKIFDDLQFDIYGDGNYYDELVAPIKEFKNVHLHRKFLPNEQLNKVYENHGIMLLPSRTDAHAVSMGESASTGLVVLGSNVTSNPYFMNEKENHTLTDPEDYKGLADIIEMLYNNPQEFLRISKNMADFTRQFKKENTVYKEIELINQCFKKHKNNLPFTIRNKSEKPILTIGVPAYNVEKYIEKTIISILRSNAASEIEILVINDGSTDSTAKIVEKYSGLSNGIVKLINKENGGHGSTINTAIAEAKGKYFRLVDGDDWVDSDNLSKLVEILKSENSDIVLTKGCYDYIEKAEFADIIKYDNLIEGEQYNFEDLTYENFGFSTYGPLLTTGNYKTSLLKKSNFKISENKPYVDMEFNAFSIKLANTITYYNLDIYRYLIGREGQTISKDVWRKKYKDHQYIIFNILDTIYSSKEFSERKKVYILNNIISQMVDSQIFMFDAICKWDELDLFLKKLKTYDKAYDYALKHIESLNGNCWLIFNTYKNIDPKRNSPIVVPGQIESMDDIDLVSYDITFYKKIKRIIKGLIPYGIIMLRRRRYNK